jgi:hypothetical protein
VNPSIQRGRWMSALARISDSSRTSRKVSERCHKEPHALQQSKQGCYSITSSARASSAHSSLGVNFCNPIKTDETRFIHLVADCLNLRELDFSCVSQMIASNFRDQGDVHNHSCRKRLDR